MTSILERAIEIALAERKAELASELGRMLTPQEEDSVVNDPRITDDVERIHKALCDQENRAGEGKREAGV